MQRLVWRSQASARQVDSPEKCHGKSVRASAWSAPKREHSLPKFWLWRRHSSSWVHCENVVYSPVGHARCKGQSTWGDGRRSQRLQIGKCQEWRVDASRTARTRRGRARFRPTLWWFREADCLQDELLVHQPQIEAVLCLWGLRRGNLTDLWRVPFILAERPVDFPCVSILWATGNDDTAAERTYIQVDSGPLEAEREHVPAEADVWARDKGTRCRWRWAAVTRAHPLWCGLPGREA